MHLLRSFTRLQVTSEYEEHDAIEEWASMCLLAPPPMDTGTIEEGDEFEEEDSS
jgi:hypothetical protein